MPGWVDYLPGLRGVRDEYDAAVQERVGAIQAATRPAELWPIVTAFGRDHWYLRRVWPAVARHADRRCWDEDLVRQACVDADGAHAVFAAVRPSTRDVLPALWRRTFLREIDRLERTDRGEWDSANEPAPWPEVPLARWEERVAELALAGPVLGAALDRADALRAHRALLAVHRREPFASGAGRAHIALRPLLLAHADLDARTLAETVDVVGDSHAAADALRMVLRHPAWATAAAHALLETRGDWVLLFVLAGVPACRRDPTCHGAFARLAATHPRMRARLALEAAGPAFAAAFQALATEAPLAACQLLAEACSDQRAALTRHDLRALFRADVAAVRRAGQVWLRHVGAGAARPGAPASGCDDTLDPTDDHTVAFPDVAPAP